MPSTVLVTGFGPFGPHITNPSAEVAKALSTYPLEDCIVHSHEMRVVYSEVAAELPKLWVEYNPDLVIHIGVHPFDFVKIEKGSFSLSFSLVFTLTRLGSFALGYCKMDINGCVPIDNKCIPNMDQSLKSSIDVDGLVEKTKATLKGEIDLCIESSDDPGRYLCGFSYYISLSHDNSKTLFVHIPPLNKHISVELLTRILAVIITTTLKNF